LDSGFLELKQILSCFGVTNSEEVIESYRSEMLLALAVEKLREAKWDTE
jgi:hypothetical protein